MRRRAILGAAGALLLAGIADAADHFDAPAAAQLDPTADIAGVFAWIDPDGEHVNLVMTVHPFAGDQAQFSDAVQYVFHINSAAGLGGEQTETLGVCQFDAEGRASCWVGDERAAGDAGARGGLTSDDGRFRVFAGLRDDPFIFAFGGFSAAVGAVVEAAPSLDRDAAGCPVVSPEVSGQLVSLLQSDGAGGPAVGTFDGQNVLALVLQIDSDLITPGGPVIGVWASTHRAERQE